MKVPSRTMSGPNSIVCPACGRGKLEARDPAGCDSCGRDVEDAILRTLEQIVSLPYALGRHACECGHPEMRLLPDRVFHCPACGSEVIPAAKPSRIERYRTFKETETGAQERRATNPKSQE